MSDCNIVSFLPNITALFCFNSFNFFLRISAWLLLGKIEKQEINKLEGCLIGVQIV